MQNTNSTLRRHWIAAAILTATATSASGVEPVDLGVGDPSPLPYCILVPDTPLDKDAKVIMVEGREVRVCCSDCVDQFLTDSFGWTSKIDEVIIRQQLPHYPLTTCIVDGKPLGANSFNYVFRNRLFRLCSGECQAKLEKAPAEFFGKLDFAVIEKQSPNYPLTECIVSGTPLGKDSTDHVVANLLIRLADLDQIVRFNRTPGKYLAEFRKAVSKRAKGHKNSEEEE